MNEECTLEGPREYCRNGVTADEKRSKISQRGFLREIRHTHMPRYIILQFILPSIFNGKDILALRSKRQNSQQLQRS